MLYMLFFFKLFLHTYMPVGNLPGNDVNIKNIFNSKQRAPVLCQALVLMVIKYGISYEIAGD